MAKIKLTYFNSRGRAELCRLILAQAGEKYEDVRIEHADWPELKKTVPLGQLPLLEVDGKVIGQSITMARYLAKRFNLAGKDDWAAAQADMVVDTVNDIGNKLIAYMFEKDENKKKELGKVMKEETMPQAIAILEKLLVSAGGKHFAGGSLTWADIAVAAFLSAVQARMGEVLVGAPALAALVTKTMNLPNIKKWIEIRPKTEM